MSDFTFLTEEQIFGNNQLEILKKYGTQSILTDFSILLGAYHMYNSYSIDGISTGCWWTKTSFDDGVGTINLDGTNGWDRVTVRDIGVRPAFNYLFSEKLENVFSKKAKFINGILEVEFGEYPQTIVSGNLFKTLEMLYSNKIIKQTGKSYTTDSVKNLDINVNFIKKTYFEYEHEGKKYVRLVGDKIAIGRVLSNNDVVKKNKPYWIEVEPIKWMIDKRTGIALSKKILFSGIQFDNKEDYKGNFENTNIKKYMDDYFSKDIIPSEIEQIKQNTNDKKQNPYKFSFDKVDEESIIKGCIESDIPVFLHGPSSEGKSARVKQIDPNCTIIYLRNASPESLNGKSVYDSTIGEMIELYPTWLKKLEDKCEKEPDKIHILFFDEITNALPSIQGIAFNIILDKEVNGIFKLPSNVRIVAAGNEMKDSLAANQLAEPLFNRFAHVYIKTTLESWLEWARENNIHPAIYSFVAYKNGDVLRSKYNGETPNADPRKWEMASKMLYATNKPEMIRSLVGEDITREFCHFCNQRVITLEDVINDNYTDADLNINMAEKYATVMSLSQVEEDNYYKVKEFVEKLGNEFSSLFDTLWIGNNDERLELVAINRKNNNSKRRIKNG